MTIYNIVVKSLFVVIFSSRCIFDCSLDERTRKPKPIQC